MATIVFAVTNHIGHLNASYKLAADLRPAGHRVAYWSGDVGVAHAASWGFEAENVSFFALRDGVVPRLAALPSARALARELEAAVPRVPEAAAALVARWKPDLLIFDPFLLCFFPAFHALAVPAVAINEKPLLDADPQVPPYTSTVVPRTGWRGRVQTLAARAYWHMRYMQFVAVSNLQDVFVGASAHRMWRRLGHQANFPVERHWLRRPAPFDFCLRNVPELVLFGSELELPRSKQLRPQVHYVGPCTSLERPEPPWSWEALDLRKYVILCALGTVKAGRGRTAHRFLRRVIAAFADDPNVSLIMAVGDPDMAAQLDAAANNVHVFASVPQLKILARADVMITHGGANSIKECIGSGVPPLVYPARADQPGNSARVLYHGIGLRGSRRWDTPRQIRRKVMRLIDDDAIRRNLARMRESFARYHDVDYATLLEYARGAGMSP